MSSPDSEDSSGDLEIFKDDFDPANLDPNELPTDWLKWKMEDEEREHQASEREAYWKRRKEEDTELLQDRDFANAVHKMSRAGYKGEHGNHEVPKEDKDRMQALYMQVTVGDYDGNSYMDCSEDWEKLKGKTKNEAQTEFIHQTNKLITKYGWNPPPGWR